MRQPKAGFRDTSRRHPEIDIEAHIADRNDPHLTRTGLQAPGTPAGGGGGSSALDQRVSDLESRVTILEQRTEFTPMVVEFVDTAAFTIQHNFGRYPVVQVLLPRGSGYGQDEYGIVPYGGGGTIPTVDYGATIQHDDLNHVSISFAAAQTGHVLLV